MLTKAPSSLPAKRGVCATIGRPGLLAVILVWRRSTHFIVYSISILCVFDCNNYL